MSYVLFTCKFPACHAEKRVEWDRGDIKLIQAAYKDWRCERHTPPPPPDPKDVALAHACARVDQLVFALNEISNYPCVYSTVASSLKRIARDAIAATVTVTTPPAGSGQGE